MSPKESTTAPQAREFYIFNGELDFNETTVGVSHDTFSPSQITVNKGDTVTLHFYNTEGAENHTYTMAEPYTMNHNVLPGTVVNITLVANTPGVFAYRCMEHQPTMTGYLVVLNA